jgi:hypothetical protein
MNTIASTFSLDEVAPVQSVTAGNRGSWLARAGAAIWRAFEESGHAQARRQLLDFATQCEGQQPELDKELRLAVSHGSAN